MRKFKWQGWLPAIVFAVAIHTLIITGYLLYKNQDAADNTQYSTDSNLNIIPTDNSTHANPTNTDSSGFNHSNTTVTSVDDTTSSNNTHKNQYARDATTSDSQMLMTNSIISVKPSKSADSNIETIKIETIRNSQLSENSEASTSRLSDEELLALDNADISANEQKYNRINIDSPNQDLNNTSESTTNINDASPSTSNIQSNIETILTARDIPERQLSQVTAPTTNSNPELAQTERINDKLSDVISQVRERNEKKIQSQQQQARLAQQSIAASRQQQAIAEVTEQLGIDEAAQAEFSNLSTPVEPLESDTQTLSDSDQTDRE